MRSALLLALALITINSTSFAQIKGDSVVTPVHHVDVPITQFITEIEQALPVKFFYLDKWVNKIEVTKSYKGFNLIDALSDIVRGRDIDIQFLYDYAIILAKDPGKDRLRQEVLTQYGSDLEVIVIGDSTDVDWGKDVVLSGTVTEENFLEPLYGATVYANEVKVGTATKKNGSYSLTLPAGEHIITTNLVGYTKKVFLLKLYAAGKLNMVLAESPLTLDEIVVEDNAINENFETAISGKTRLSAKTIKKIPTFLGEVDVIKSIQILPGVNTVGEGSSGFNVRGGSADQNLILLDQGIIFNPNHLFGFFSAFHPDALREVTFYRGAIPAQYGGRISSVLDVQQKDGNTQKISGSGGVGLVTGRLMLEGPIVKDKLSFLVAGRSSYSDLLLSKVRNTELNNSSAFFYDFTGKISGFINKKTKISASYYASQDQFKFADDTTFVWKNSSASINMEHLFSNRFSLHSNISFGTYDYEVQDEDIRESFTWKYGVDNFKAGAYISYNLGNHTFLAGADWIRYNFRRGELNPQSDESNVTTISLDDQQSNVLGLFLSDAIKINDAIEVIPGLRFSSYFLNGPITTYVYDELQPKDDLTIVDSTLYDNGAVAKRYSGLEPSVSLKLNMSPTSFIKAGYSHNYQYIHLISNTTAITPIDSWVPSTNHLKPQIGDQYSLGYFRKFKANTIKASLEVFYKHIENVPEYKNGAQLALKDNIETELINSEAIIHGLEFSIRKEGRLYGELNYTYSSSQRKSQTSFKSLEINDNELFPANYDRPHNVKLNASYDISKRHVLSFNFNLASGRPISAPVERFVVDGFDVYNFSERNQLRIPTYHRLDVSLLVKTSHRENKKWEGSWTFTLFNVYARKNAYSVYFESKEGEPPKAYKLSILGTIFPSITYNFKF